MDADACGDGWPGTSIGVLSDDLLAQCLAVLDDGTLRVAAGTCRRWAALLRERSELFRSVRFDLPPKRSRGRDRSATRPPMRPSHQGRPRGQFASAPLPGLPRASGSAPAPALVYTRQALGWPRLLPAPGPPRRRNSYTTPCALNVERLAAWLARRSGAIVQLHVGLLYPDALALLWRLLPPLAPALRRLVLEGGCMEWPHLWVDWRWLAGMTRVRLGLAGLGWAAGSSVLDGPPERAGLGKAWQEEEVE